MKITAEANLCFLLLVCLSVGGTGFVNSTKYRRLAVYYPTLILRRQEQKQRDKKYPIPIPCV